jgi:hypothetical protein
MSSEGGFGVESDDRFTATTSSTPGERLRQFRTHAARVRELVQQSHTAAMEAKDQCAALAKEAEELEKDVPAARRAFFNPIKDQAEYLAKVVQGEDDEDFAWQKPIDESEDLVALAEFAVQQAQDRMPSGLELP